MSDSPRIVCRPHPDVSPEEAQAARVRAWAYIFRCWQEKQMTAEQGPKPDGHDDAKESNGRAATGNYTA